MLVAAGPEGDPAAAAPLFGSLNRDALRLLCFAADRRSLAAGERLFARGERGDGGFGSSGTR